MVCIMVESSSLESQEIWKLKILGDHHITSHFNSLQCNEHRGRNRTHSQRKYLSGTLKNKSVQSQIS
jgi:hypothetical protein